METDSQDNKEMQSEMLDGPSEEQGQQKELQRGKKSVHIRAKAKKALKIANRLAKKETLLKTAKERKEGRFKSV